MKLAVMLYGSRVSPRFGYSQGVLIVDYSGQQEIHRKTLEVKGTYPEQIPELLGKEGVKVVISGGMNPHFQNLFRLRGIKVIWGIIGAVVMRFIFIFTGAALVRQFDWILYIFGGILIFTGIKLFIDRNKQDKIDPSSHPVVKFASKYFNVYNQFVGHRFFVKIDGKHYITPLFIVLLVIEFSDVIFAVDSIPAIFAVSKDPYIIFFSNIFAILGLRALFFLLANVLNRFYYLKIGLAVLLTFIGVKMLVHEPLKEIGFQTVHSLYVILGILSISVLASVLFPPKQKISND